MSFLKKEWKKMAPDNGGGSGNTSTTLDKVAVYNGKIIGKEDSNENLKPFKIQYSPKLQDKTHTLNNQSETLNVSAAQAAGYDGYGNVTINAKIGTCENDVTLNDLVYDNNEHTITATAYGKTKDNFSTGWIETKPANSSSKSKSIDLDTILTATKTVLDKGTYNVVGYKEFTFGPVPQPPKDVNFMDYDGTILYSYTANDFQNLTELPPNPLHDGLTAQGWNWSLSDAKSYVNSYGELYIGQTYVTTSGKTEIDIELLSDNSEFYLYLQLASANISIRWGDGGSMGIAGTGSPTINHTYATKGQYTITIEVSSGSFDFYRSDSNFSVSWNKIQAVRMGLGSGIGEYGFSYCTNLKYITIPLNVTSLGGYSFTNCHNLSYFIIPNSITSIDNATYIFSNSNNIYISFPKMNSTTIPSYTFDQNFSLKSVPVFSGITEIQDRAYKNCFTLEKIIVPETVTTIDTAAFYRLYSLKELHFKPINPPEVTSSNVFSGLPSTCTIYVPTGTLSDYTSATNYPSSATYTYLEE